MCLAIVKPAGEILPEDHIREGWISNPDGGGYGFVNEEGNTVIRKGFGKLKEFTEAYKEDEEKNPGSPFLVHFRICTMGTKGPENTHPFATKHGILIHNGTITGTAATYGTGKSDTAFFAERFSEDLTFDFIMNNREKLNSALHYNKVAMLFKDKRFAILNEQDGVWDANVWYSNRTYETGRSASYHWYNEGMYDD